MLITTPADTAPTDPPTGLPADVEIALEMRKLSLWYTNRRALEDVSFAVPARKITALIGPSASGKSSLLRCLTRLNDEIPDCRVEGQVLIGGGADIHAKNVAVHELRRRVGMVFQRPNPFPLTVYENVAYGPRLLGVKRRHTLDE
jgi:phosphate transport system ATP-binding protein